LRKIGITGNIGSGKSTVSKIFQVLGISVYDADSRAKWLMTNDNNLIIQIKQIFGNEAYFNDNSLNRKHISDIAFVNKSKLNELNSAVHPAVAQDFKNWSDNQNSDYILKEAALLIESKSYLDLYELILVKCPLETRIQRTMSRDGVDRSSVEARINNQMSEEDKVPYSNYIINNDGNELVITQVLKIHHQILEKI
jgi:dephospho-CoA kinase